MKKYPSTKENVERIKMSEKERLEYINTICHGILGCYRKNNFSSVKHLTEIIALMATMPDEFISQNLNLFVQSIRDAREYAE